MSWNQPSSLTTDVRDERISAFLSKVYAWMFLGLLITAGTALVVASSPALVRTIFVDYRFLFWGIVLAQFGLVVYLSARVTKMAPITASALFLLYSALVGVTSSVILWAFTTTSIFTTFMVTAGMFGATALYGTVTKRSLAGLGQFMFMGLIGLILAMVVGIFWQNDALQFVISVIGVLVFTGLTAWDAQRLKQMAVSTPEGHTSSLAIVGALALYLDFINLFFFLLRFTGNRRS